jgi:hypothetical protein
METEQLFRNLAKHNFDAGNRHSFEFIDAATKWRVSMKVEAADSLSTQIWEVAIFRDSQSATASTARFNDLALAMGKRVKGLLEPLRLIEVDVDSKVAILRSDEPTVRKSVRAHYELRIIGENRAELRRYQASTAPASKRAQFGFTLTNEVLGNFLNDVTDVFESFASAE